jgi:dolichyldiphosphatase
MAFTVLNLTYVWYNKGDFISLLLACSSLLPIAIVIAVLTLFVSRRDLQTCMLGIGAVFCELLNTILKRVIRHPRPLGMGNGHFLFPNLIRFLQESLRTGNGMPSDHAQFMFFIAVYTTLILLPMRSSKLYKIICGIFLFSMSSIVTYSR